MKAILFFLLEVIAQIFEEGAVSGATAQTPSSSDLKRQVEQAAAKTEAGNAPSR